MGRHYDGPREALKEHATNALDEHRKALDDGNASVNTCEVVFEMYEDRIVIEYPYGMTESRFEEVLQGVAKSRKSDLDVKQTGRFGIGLFCFFQVGDKCTFVSRGSENDDGVKVTIEEGDVTATFDQPKKREMLNRPGMRVVISQLHENPTDGRKKLGWSKFEPYLARTFSAVLHSGNLAITLRYPGRNKEVNVEPPEINLPTIAEEFSPLYVKGDEGRQVSLELYYHPSGDGVVGIRQADVRVIDDISELEDALGISESVFGSGDLHGFIDADFLKPLPSRNAFKQNDDFTEFLVALGNIHEAIEAQVQSHRRQRELRRRSRVQEEAIEVAEEIIEEDDLLQELELFEGGDKPSESLPQFPDDDFDFVPGSLRVTPGESGKIPLRAIIPDGIEDGTQVTFTVDENFVAIEPESVTVSMDDTDEFGMVKARVTVYADHVEDKVAILTAETETRKAEAPIHVAEKTETRDTGGETGDQDADGRPSYVELPLEDPFRHSRYDSVSNTVEVNELHPLFQELVEEGDEKEMLIYSALVWAKQIIACNDSTGQAEKYLEKLLTYQLRLIKERLL
jgi:hypothetical protein